MSGRNWTCNFCGTEGLKKFTITRFSKAFDIWQCPHCNLMFQYPKPDPKEIENYYQEGYYSGVNNFSYEDERKQFKFYSYVWNSRINKLKKRIHTQNQSKFNILDIGCSFGGLLENAEKNGFNGYGIELSDFSRNYANKNLNHKVFKSFEDAKFQNNFFDVISMIELIEHLTDPLTELKKCKDLLKPGGILLIQTANMDGQQAKKEKENYHYFLPGHLFYFSKKNLRNKLKEIGFKKIQFFHPVEFGLIPKLKKSRANFKTFKDYIKWINIIYYHLKSLIHFKDFCLTSSMVVYAWK